MWRPTVPGMLRVLPRYTQEAYICHFFLNFKWYFMYASVNIYSPFIEFLLHWNFLTQAFAWLLCSYELAYDGERTTCNGATTATSAFPQATTNLEKMKEKWNSLEKPTGAHDKGPVPHAHNGEKMHANHSNNGEIGGSHQGHSMVHHNGEPHEHYRWSKCKRPLPLSSMRSKGVPLPADYVEVS